MHRGAAHRQESSNSRPRTAGCSVKGLSLKTLQKPSPVRSWNCHPQETQLPEPAAQEAGNHGNQIPRAPKPGANLQTETLKSLNPEPHSTKARFPGGQGLASRMHSHPKTPQAFLALCARRHGCSAAAPHARTCFGFFRVSPWGFRVLRFGVRDFR